MDKSEVLDIINNYDYYTFDDLRYNKKVGYLLGKEELGDFVRIKDELINDGNELFYDLPLLSFNSQHIFFTASKYLDSVTHEYLTIINDDLSINERDLFTRNVDDIIMSRAFSEIEGSLGIENIPTTHRLIREICENENIEDTNAIIIRNMIAAMRYIVDEEPEFNKENLRKLYGILSDNCLDAEDKIDGLYYRDDVVSVGGFEGAPHEKIGEMMDSLFAFANDVNVSETIRHLLPHICHYYILYVHPYFDYNGRTARMVSFWISTLYKINHAPMFISEAINENKSSYYHAITNTRIMNNDLTYFLGYIMEASTRFSLIYKNIEHIEELLNEHGDFLSKTDKMSIKKILIHSPSAYFNHKMFSEYIGNNVTKQRALKVLNDMTEEGLLEKRTNKKKEAIFKLNQDLLIYNI